MNVSSIAAKILLFTTLVLLRYWCPARRDQKRGVFRTHVAFVPFSFDLLGDGGGDGGGGGRPAKVNLHERVSTMCTNALPLNKLRIHLRPKHKDIASTPPAPASENLFGTLSTKATIQSIKLKPSSSSQPWVSPLLRPP